MKSPRHSNHPMPAEEHEELARELSEFGYRETDDPDEADQRRYYKVEKWDANELHSWRYCTPATTCRGPEQSSPPRRRVGRAGPICCARTSAC